MARPEKVAKVDAVSAQLTAAGATLLTHYRGLSVSEISELRRTLRDANAQMHVVKNTLVRRAADKAGIDGLTEMLVGPTALIFCEEDPVGAAKALKAFAKDHPGLVVRGGYFDGELLDEHDAVRLADLDSREDSLARLVGLMHGALANTARLLKAPLEQQGRLLQALVDAGGAAGAPEGADTPADVAEDSANDTAEADAGDDAASTDASEDAAPEEAADAAAPVETADASADAETPDAAATPAVEASDDTASDAANDETKTD